MSGGGGGGAANSCTSDDHPNYRFGNTISASLVPRL